MIDALRQMIGMDARSYLLRVPREKETEGLLLLGDPGTGKSQVILQLLAQIASRNPTEAVFVMTRQASSSRTTSIWAMTSF